MAKRMEAIKLLADKDVERVRLSDVADVIRGVTYKKDDATAKPATGLVAILRANNIQDRRLITDEELVFVPKDLVGSEQLLRKGDVVIATSSGSKDLVGKAAPLREDWRGSFGAFCAAVRPKEDIEPLYLAHFFESPEYKDLIRKKALGVNINNLRRGDLEDLKIPLAPLPEQRRIVSAIETQLGRLDAAVARLQGAKARLKRYKQAVLKAAVEGSYCETPLEEWTENVLGDIATTIRNGYSKKPNAEEGIRIFRISAVRPLDLFVDDVRYLEAGTKDHEASMVTPGDVLFTRYNGSRDMVGACALVPNDCPPTVHPDKLIRVRVPSDELLPGMLAILGTVGEGRAYIESKIRTTAGQSGISGGDLKSLPLRYPPVEDQKRIIQDVEVRLNGMQELETTLDAQLQQAVRLRQAVLKRAFEGRLG